MNFNKSIKKIIDIAKECCIVEEEYAQTQLELIVRKAIELQVHMDNMYWSERCNLLHLRTAKTLKRLTRQI